MNMKSVVYFYKGITVPQEGSLVGLLVDRVVQSKSAQFDWDWCNVTASQVWGPANDFWKLWGGEGGREQEITPNWPSYPVSQPSTVIYLILVILFLEILSWKTDYKRFVSQIPWKSVLYNLLCLGPIKYFLPFEFIVKYEICSSTILILRERESGGKWMQGLSHSCKSLTSGNKVKWWYSTVTVRGRTSTPQIWWAYCKISGDIGRKFVFNTCAWI